MAASSSSGGAYPLKAVRAMALHAQGLSAAYPRGARKTGPDIEEVYSAVERVGWVQIDTLQVVNRSQYLTLWSRLCNYDTALFDALLFDGGSAEADNERRLFEYWTHAACIVPLTEYRYLIPMMRRRANGRGGWHKKWAADPDNQRLMKSVLEGIKTNGAARPADFRTEKKAPGAWWNWDSAKIALEHLYDKGDLAISNRVNFQRIYDVRERVIPSWVDTTEPSEEEAFRRLLEISMKALGACAPIQVGDYFHMRRGESRPLIESLIAEGVFVRVNATLADHKTHELITHRDSLPTLEMAGDGALPARRTTFLSPFDSLFWAKDRDMAFWKFRQVLECYKPEPTRDWGYFCLPILHGDRLVGRFDPKVERKTGLMRLKSLYLEPGVKPGARLVSGTARAMRDFMRFHNADDLAVEYSDPPEFGEKLLAAM